LILFVLCGLSFLGTWNVWDTTHQRGKHLRRQDEDGLATTFGILLALSVGLLACGLLLLFGYRQAAVTILFGSIMFVAVVVALLIMGASAGLLTLGALALLSLLLLPVILVVPSMRARSERWRGKLVAQHKRKPKRKRKNDELV